MSSKRIVIVGGGVIGLSIAHHLVEKGAHPIVIEKSSFAREPGQKPEFDEFTLVLRGTLGWSTPAGLWMSVPARRLLRTVVSGYAIAPPNRTGPNTSQSSAGVFSGGGAPRSLSCYVPEAAAADPVPRVRNS